MAPGSRLTRRLANYVAAAAAARSCRALAREVGIDGRRVRTLVRGAGVPTSRFDNAPSRDYT
jgi:hypothetical protein